MDMDESNSWELGAKISKEMENTCKNCAYAATLYIWSDNDTSVMCDYHKCEIKVHTCDEWKPRQKANNEDTCRSCAHAILLEVMGESGKYYAITNCELSDERIYPNHAPCHDFTPRDSIAIESKEVKRLPDGGGVIKCKLADGERPDWFKNMFGDKEKTEKEYDPVNSPKHYTSGKVECIDAMIETYGVEVVKHFCLCNVFKYHWRHELKNGEEDIKKATWYMDKYKELENR